MCIERRTRSGLLRKRHPPKHLTMVTKPGIIFLLFVGTLYTTEAAIAWTTPGSSGAVNFTTTLSIGEDQTLNAEIMTYIASTTGTGPVSYALTPAVSPFALTAGGELTITSTVDHETKQTYTLNIVATDANSPPSSGTLIVTVTVTDVNEHDPVFSPASYSTCIADKSPADTTLTTVTATDQDTSQTLTYTFASGNTNTDFKIDASSGLIQVNTGKTLDKANTATYDLVVHAVDDVATLRTGSATVSVTVADSCDSGSAVVAVSMVMLFVSLIVTLF